MEHLFEGVQPRVVRRAGEQVVRDPGAVCVPNTAFVSEKAVVGVGTGEGDVLHRCLLEMLRVGGIQLEVDHLLENDSLNYQTLKYHHPHCTFDH